MVTLIFINQALRTKANYIRAPAGLRYLWRN